jgi:hypothetical protein
VIQLEEAFLFFFADENLFSDAVGLTVATRAHLVPKVLESKLLWGVPGIGAIVGFVMLYMLLSMKSVARRRNAIVVFMYESFRASPLLQS